MFVITFFLGVITIVYNGVYITCNKMIDHE